MEGKDSGRTAKLLLCGRDGIRDLVDLVALDLVRQELGFSRDEVAEAVTKSRYRSAVVGLHREAERDQQQQVGKFREVESRVALSAAQGRLDAEPGQKDHGQSAKQTQPHGLEQTKVRVQEIADGLGQE